jgi:hypothetical protein
MVTCAAGFAAALTELSRKLPPAPGGLPQIAAPAARGPVIGKKKTWC